MNWDFRLTTSIPLVIVTERNEKSRKIDSAKTWD
jgi:hypothetical protein